MGGSFVCEPCKCEEKELGHSGENCAEMILVVGECDHGFVFASYHAWPHLITTKFVFSLLEDSLLWSFYIVLLTYFGFSALL